MFARLSIRQKLTAMLMLISGTVLALASIAFVTWDLYRFRADTRADLATQARLVLDNAAAAITFNDREAARELLDLLELHPHTQLACLYLPTGELFAARVFRDPADQCPAVPTSGFSATASRLVLAEQLVRGNNSGARVLIAVDRAAERARLRAELVAIASIIAAGMALSFLLSNQLQRLIAAPIARLADTARSISSGGDYSIRAAVRPTHDEIGVMVQSFNAMLDEIQASHLERTEALQREQEANRLKDEFLATLSHELRTPLNAIVGWVHLARRGELPPDQMTHALERIDRNAHAQARLVQDLLDVSRIASGKLLLEPREMDLATVVANAIDACQPAADGRRVALRWEGHGPFPTMGDPDRLQQVVWNLLTNAIRFTPALGLVTVVLRRDGDMDTLEVRDTGAGIDPQFLPYIFEPFRQADAASTRTHGGLGIGLTVVRRLTEMHGGTVQAASGGKGQGAVFTVTLPVRRAVRAFGAATAPHRSASSLSKATVLVVDDNPDTLILLESTLAMAGATSIGAASVAEALQRIDGTTFDALISDIAMPDQDGYTLLALLKERLGSTMPTATIALTAYASKADRERALIAGFREHLTKPVNPDVLIQTLEDLLGGDATSAPRSV
jgi:signal transduction histidine kinase/ActR/RegA family two-component response regulator